jgi:hypothetical protein
MMIQARIEVSLEMPAVKTKVLRIQFVWQGFEFLLNNRAATLATMKSIDIVVLVGASACVQIWREPHEY